MKTTKLLVGLLTALLWLNITCLAHGETDGKEEGKKREASESVVDKKTSTDATPATNATSSSTEEQLLLLNERMGKLEEIIQQQQRMIEELRNQLKNEKNSSIASSVTASAPTTISTVEASANIPKKAEKPQTDAVPAKKPEWIELAEGKIKIGTLIYADHAFYIKTGFGPQFLTQINQPGPGNDNFNSFEISRAYINLYYSPNEALTFRLTPNLFRAIGVASASKFGKNSAIASNLDGELSYRIKLAYLDFNTLFSSIEPLKGDKLTIGVQSNPLVAWEENLYGYRFVNLVPWNYLGFSSAQTGVSLHGPVKFGGKQYIDYDFGTYTNASFRQLEQSEKKQVMARVSVYPFGAQSTYDGLGLTGFIDYGFTNVAPDTDASKPLYRVAALAHYTKKNFGIAGEYDYGRNALTTGALFSGSGPADEFGLGPTPFANFDALAKALQNNDRTKQEGFAFFGHVKIPNSPFEIFGMYQRFFPNTRVDKNPLDLQRIVAGISYRYSSHLRFALDSQNLDYTHSQFTFPAAELIKFDPVLAGKNPNGIPKAVTKGINAIFLNVEFSF